MALGADPVSFSMVFAAGSVSFASPFARPLVPGYVALLVGVAFALGWTLRIGPTLAAALSVAAAGGDPPLEAALLLVYGLGLGVPFLQPACSFARRPGPVTCDVATPDRSRSPERASW